MKPKIKKPAGALTGFTLVEVLIATAISAIIVLAVNTLLYHAFHLRDKAYDTLAYQAAERYALNTMQNDLRNITPPNGTLEGDMVGESGSRGSLANDTLEFYTTTGTITESLPWGEVQKVKYSLMDVGESLSPYGLCLIREITRNLLAPTEEKPEYAPILPNVRSLQFYYYDGDTWQTSWDSSSSTSSSSTTSSSSSSSTSDSSTEESPLPKAIQVELVVSRGYKQNAARDEDLITETLMVPIVTEPIPTPTPSSSSESTSTDSGTDSGQDQQGGGGRS